METLDIAANGQWSLEKAVLIKKPGEKKGLTPNERSHKELENRLKSDPKFREEALSGNQNEFNLKQQKEEKDKTSAKNQKTLAEFKEKKENKGYDDSVKHGEPLEITPVATRKRSGPFIDQFKRRKESMDRKLENKESRGEFKKASEKLGDLIKSLEELLA